MREQVMKLLEAEFPEIDFAGSETLADDGILDSLTITGIVASLTMEYGIQIPYEEITAENFNSIDSMAKMVERISGN